MKLPVGLRREKEPRQTEKAESSQFVIAQGQDPLHWIAHGFQRALASCATAGSSGPKTLLGVPPWFVRSSLQTATGFTRVSRFADANELNAMIGSRLL